MIILHSKLNLSMVIPMSQRVNRQNEDTVNLNDDVDLATSQLIL